jgi:pyruvate/2-oxoglutarate dehydrogenase complex dihydrolipoamide dehydrogenase (E3) component
MTRAFDALIIGAGQAGPYLAGRFSGAARQILGAANLGTGGDEVIHSLLDVMYAKAPYTVVQRAMHIHPTVSELLPTMLGELKPLA